MSMSPKKIAIHYTTSISHLLQLEDAMLSSWTISTRTIWGLMASSNTRGELLANDIQKFDFGVLNEEDISIITIAIC